MKNRAFKSIQKGLKEASEGKVSRSYSSVKEMLSVMEEERKNRTVFQKIYYFVYYKIWRKIEDIPYQCTIGLYRNIKWFIQRGKRGWADCDTWNLDYSLAVIMHDSIEYLKKHKNGCPATLSPRTGTYTFNEKRWNKILDDILQGLKVLIQIGEGNIEYFSEETPEDIIKDYNIHMKDYDVRVINQKERKQIKKAFELLKKHWLGLWD